MTRNHKALNIMKIFNIELEFNSKELFKKIDSFISESKKGYVCVCDSSVVTRAQKDQGYCTIINSAFVNSCDGSSICTLAKMIYGGNLESVNGPELFAKYTKLPYKQVILGNTDDIVEKVRDKLKSENISDDHINHLNLPFCNVDEFDYARVAEQINTESYDIIWVSLGNPKQEIFMSKIMPFLNKGILFGIGAALNFYVGQISLPKFQLGPLRFIWLTRLFEDKRQWKSSWDFLKILPSMYFKERVKAKLITQQSSN